MTPLQSQITEWQQIKAWMAVAKEREMTLRNAIAEATFTKEANGAFKEGTQSSTVDVGDSVVKIKLTGKLNYKIDEEKVEILGALSNCKELVKWKAELSVSEYRKLTENERRFADAALIIKPGAIELEIVEVKK